MRKRSQVSSASAAAPKKPTIPEKEPPVDEDETPKASAPKRRRKKPDVGPNLLKKEEASPEKEPESAAEAQEPAGETDVVVSSGDTEASELKMGGGFDDIIDTLFNYDVAEDYDSILKALILDMKASQAEYGHLMIALDQAEENARKGLQIVANAKVSRKAFDAEADAIEARLREAAVEILEADVEAGTRQKRYTKDDIQSLMITNYHDEWRDLEMGRAKAKATEEYLEGLARTVQERARDLRVMVAGAARH